MENYVEVILLKDWFTHKKGDKITIRDVYLNIMRERGYIKWKLYLRMTMNLILNITLSF